MAVLCGEGHSLRATAGAVGVSKSQIDRDVVSRAGQLQEPTTVRGLDSKDRPAKRTARKSGHPDLPTEPKRKQTGVIEWGFGDAQQLHSSLTDSVQFAREHQHCSWLPAPLRGRAPAAVTHGEAKGRGLPVQPLPRKYLGGRIRGCGLDAGRGERFVGRLEEVTPAHRCANRLAVVFALVTGGAPAVYSWEFTDPHAFNVEVTGKYHAIEDGHDANPPFLFQWNPGHAAVHLPAFTRADRRIADQMDRYWGNFARTGTRTVPGSPHGANGRSGPARRQRS